MPVTMVIVAAGVVAAVMVGMVVLLKITYQAVHPGQVMVINKAQGAMVVMEGGAIVMPVIHRAEFMDITTKSVIIERRGKDGLICRDNIRADIQAEFLVRVNRTEEDVLKVAQSIGTERASDPRTIGELFAAKFSEALKSVAKMLEFAELFEKRGEFRDQVIQVIGRDLSGFVLDDLVIDYLEQTPIEALDPNNILDAEGIRKIRERTGAENRKSEQLKAEQRKAERDVEIADSSSSSDEAPPIFGQPVDVDVSELMPDNSQVQVAFDRVTKLRIESPKGSMVCIEHNSAMLTIEEDERVLLSVRLDESFQVKLSRDEDFRLGLALRQAQQGTDIRLRFVLEGEPLQIPTENQAAAAISRLRRQNLEGLLLDEHGPHLLLVLRHYYLASGGDLQDWV